MDEADVDERAMVAKEVRKATTRTRRTGGVGRPRGELKVIDRNVVGSFWEKRGEKSRHGS